MSGVEWACVGGVTGEMEPERLANAVGARCSALPQLTPLRARRISFGGGRIIPDL